MLVLPTHHGLRSNRRNLWAFYLQTMVDVTIGATYRRLPLNYGLRSNRRKPMRVLLSNHDLRSNQRLSFFNSDTAKKRTKPSTIVKILTWFFNFWSVVLHFLLTTFVRHASSRLSFD